ncbi:MAG: hypothetical protein J6K46_03230 [Sutterella sp.]|nr:hypothetical protein [Sutterella sp.]
MTHKSPLIPIVAGLLILAGCAGRPDNYLYHADVREARVALERAYKMQADSRLHFVQPQNHLETCRIPLEKAYADTPDKTVIWDGGCTGGYAHGLGRIIYRSETESFDRVVDADFRTVRRLLFAEFDYLRNTVLLAEKPNDGIGAELSRKTIYREREGRLESVTVADVFRTDANGSAAYFSSPLSPALQRTVCLNGVCRTHVDLRAMPHRRIDQIGQEWFMTGPDLKRRVGIAFQQNLASGEVTAYRYGEKGASVVLVPDDAFESFVSEFGKFDGYGAKFDITADKVRRMVERYQNTVCRKAETAKLKNKNNPDNSRLIPAGISAEEYLRVCGFENALRQKLDAAVSVYKKELTEAQASAPAELQRSLKEIRARTPLIGNQVD